MGCPSKRLMTKVKQLYFGSNSKGNLSANDTIQLTSTLNLNQEPIIFQVGRRHFAVLLAQMKPKLLLIWIDLIIRGS